MKFAEILKEFWEKIIGKVESVMDKIRLSKKLKIPSREEMFFILCVAVGVFVYLFAQEISTTGEGDLGIILFTFVLMYGIIVFSNKKLLSVIEDVEIWEIIFGVLIILFSYYGVGLIKQSLGLGFRFGVTNTVIFLAGLTIVFYGIRRLDVTWAFFLLLAALSVANIVFIGNSPIDILAGRTLAPLEASWVSSLLNAFGYKTTVEGTSTVVFLDRYAVIAIGGECTGIQGMTLYTTLTGGMMIGTGIPYKKRAIFLCVGAAILFLLNFLRLVILSLVAYHYGMAEMYSVHEWLGGVIFLIFVFFFWVLVIGREIRKVSSDVCAEEKRKSDNTDGRVSDGSLGENRPRTSEEEQETGDSGSS